MNENNKPDQGDALRREGNSDSDEALERRRKAVRSILTGAGLVTGSQALTGTWTRPVIETVMLPAHAQTTNVVLGGPIGGGISSTGGSDAGILEHLVRPAHAGDVVLVGGCIRLEILGSSASVLLVLANNLFGINSFTISSVSFSVNVLIATVTYTITGQFDQVPIPTQATGTASGGGELGNFKVTVGAAGSCVQPSAPGTTAAPATTTATPTTTGAPTTTTYNPCTTPEPYYYLGNCYSTPPF